MAAAKRVCTLIRHDRARRFAAGDRLRTARSPGKARLHELADGRVLRCGETTNRRGDLVQRLGGHREADEGAPVCGAQVVPDPHLAILHTGDCPSHGERAPRGVSGWSVVSTGADLGICSAVNWK